MADFNAQQLVANDMGESEADAGAIPGQELMTAALFGQSATPDGIVAQILIPEAVGAPFLVKMRALASPGPGYVTWVTNEPDFDGASAGAPIQAGTAVVIDTWPAP